MNKLKEPEVLAGAKLEQDCQPTAGTEMASQPLEEDDEDEHPLNWQTVATDPAGTSPLASWLPQRGPWLHRLEKIALAIERPVNRLVGTTQLNPFYHTGTIAIFLLLVVGLTGVYLFLFFQYGFEASYNAVNRMEGLFIARTIRAIHRYASGALVITTLLHAYRTLFMAQFRGPRWLAWVTGLLLTAIIWLGGVTGYWLVWDERAQYLTDTFVYFLQKTTSLAPNLMLWLQAAGESGQSWPVLLLLLVAHVGLFLVSLWFFWLHVRRLSRPKWLPDMPWVVGMGLVLLVGSVLFPAGMLAQANANQMPKSIFFDPFFLFFLPIGKSNLAFWLWGGLLLVGGVGLALPWLSPKGQTKAQPVVHIYKDRCTGCTKCALDCPYQAIQMVERHDNKPHKFIAIEDPALCVSCGICIGSCDGLAVTLGDLAPEMVWLDISSRLALAQAKAPAGHLKVIFTCERHASQGLPANFGDNPVEVIAFPCVGTVAPDLLTKTLEAGVAEVEVVGCPPNDCLNREGNLWSEQRLTRQRVPRLKKSYANAPITAAWLPPNEFAQAIPLTPLPPPGEDGQTPDYLSGRVMYKPYKWTNLLIAFGLLAFIMAIQIIVTNVPLRPYPAGQAMVQLMVADPSAPFSQSLVSVPAGTPVELQLSVDGRPIYSQSYQSESLYAGPSQSLFYQQMFPAGTYHLQLVFLSGGNPFILFEQQVILEAGQIFIVGYAPAGECHQTTCPQ